MSKKFILLILSLFLISSVYSNVFEEKVKPLSFSDRLEDYGRYLRLKNKVAFDSNEENNYEELYFELEEIYSEDQILEELQELFTSRDDKKVSRVLYLYPELKPFIEENIPLLRNVTRRTEFDDNEYSRYLSRFSVDDYLLKYFIKTWEKAHKEYKNIGDKKQYKKVSTRLERILYYYDKVKNLFSFGKSEAEKAFKKGFKDYGKEYFNNAEKEFYRSKTLDKKVFKTKNGSHWRGFSLKKIDMDKDEIQELKESAIHEDKLHSINSLNTIDYLYNAEYNQVKENKEEAAIIFKEIKENDDSEIIAQMYAHQKRINNLIEAGIMTDVFEEKETYFNSAASEITSYISTYCISMEMDSNGYEWVYKRSYILSVLSDLLLEEAEYDRALVYIEKVTQSQMFGYTNWYSFYKPEDDRLIIEYPLIDEDERFEMLYKLQKYYSYIITSVYEKEIIKEKFLGYLDKIFEYHDIFMNYHINDNKKFSKEYFAHYIEIIGDIINEYTFIFYKEDLIYDLMEQQEKVFSIASQKYPDFIDRFIEEYVYTLVFLKQTDKAMKLFENIDVHKNKKIWARYIQCLYESGNYQVASMEAENFLNNSMNSKEADFYVAMENGIKSLILYAKEMENDQLFEKAIQYSDQYIYYLENSDLMFDFLHRSEARYIRALASSTRALTIENDSYIQEAKQKLEEYKAYAIDDDYFYGLNQADYYYQNTLLDIKSNNVEDAVFFITRYLDFLKEIHLYYYETLNKKERIEYVQDYLKSLFKVEVDPVIESMEPGETVTLTAKLVDKDGNEFTLPDSLEVGEFTWEGTANPSYDYTLAVHENDSSKAEFTLVEGDFMDIIITAKVKINFKELQERYASVEIPQHIEIEGDNQVPVMLVNEEGRRITVIPMINPENLEGINMGSSSSENEEFFCSVEFLTDYSLQTVDKCKFLFVKDEEADTQVIELEETTQNSGIFRGYNKENDLIEIYISFPLQNDNGIPTLRESSDSTIEYVKKNNEYVSENPLNIPAYDNNGSLYISNLIINDNETESLDQEQFIPDDAIFYIKMIDDDLSADETYINLKASDINNRENIAVKLTKKAGYYISGAKAFVEEKYNNYNNIMLKNKNVEFLISPFQDEFAVPVLYAIYKDKYIKIGNGNKNAYMIKCWGLREKLSEFINCAENLMRLGFSITLDNSPTKEEFEKNIDSIDLLYTFSHGYIDQEDVFNGTQLFGNLIIYSNENFLKGIGKDMISYKSFQNKDYHYKLVFFNGCSTGDEDFYKKFLENFTAETYIGWKEPVNPIDASNLAEKFFEYANTKDEGKYLTVAEALLKAYNELFPEYSQPNLELTRIKVIGKKDLTLKEQ